MQLHRYIVTICLIYVYFTTQVFDLFRLPKPNSNSIDVLFGLPNSKPSVLSVDPKQALAKIYGAVGAKSMTMSASGDEDEDEDEDDDMEDVDLSLDASELEPDVSEYEPDPDDESSDFEPAWILKT